MANPLKDFTIQTVLRNTSPEVLQLYLEETALSGLIILPKISAKKKYDKEEYVDALMKQIDALSKQRFATLMKGFLRVYMLTRHKGHVMTAFLQRSQLHGTDAIAFLNDYKKPYDAAFMLWLRLRDQVDEYYLVFMSEQQNKRYWNKRRDYVPAEAAKFTKSDVQQLKEEVKARLQKERRGNHCNERLFDFDGKTYIFLMADDQPVIDREWKEKEIDDLHYIPVFQIAIAYDEKRGEVDICCENTTTRLSIHQAFAKTKFGLEEIPDYPQDDMVYDLKHAFDLLLKRQRIDLAKPEDTTIKDIFIKAVRFRVDNLGGVEILLDSKRTNRPNSNEDKRPDSIFIMVGSFFGLDKSSRNEISINDAAPVWIEWVAVYPDPYDKNITIREKFTISGKNTCSLDFDGIHGGIRTCLENNGIITKKAPSLPVDTPPAKELAVFP